MQRSYPPLQEIQYEVGGIMSIQHIQKFVTSTLQTFLVICMNENL